MPSLLTCYTTYSSEPIKHQMETYEQQYHTVMHTSKELDSGVLDQKKIKIENFFQEIGISTTGLHQTFQEKHFSLYEGEVRSILGSNMENFDGTDSSVIVLDKKFRNNPKNQIIINTQLTHELLHSVSILRRGKDKPYFIMGHPEPGYSGMYEASIQMFAELIEGYQLTPEEDYLHFVKNAMKTVSDIVHISRVARQFLNQDRSLEWEIQGLAKNLSWFPTFTSAMQTSYDCSKAIWYQGADKKSELNSANKIIVEQLKQLVDAKANTDKNFKREKVVIPNLSP